MRVLTSAESRRWLDSIGFRSPLSATDSFPLLPPTGFGQLNCSYPTNSGKKVALARWLHRSVATDNEVLIWLQNWTVWPSMGHLPLIHRLREALGENKSLDDFPAQVFSSEEGEDAISVLTLALEFFWDCLLVGSNLRFVCFFSHDGYYSPMTNDAILLAQLRKSLSSGNWGIMKSP
jgi:hypothetical protein